jgi:putative transposase
MYRTIFVPLKCNQNDFQYLKKLNKVSSDVWNNCLKIDKEYIKLNKKFMTLSQLEFENKQKFPLHAKGINHIVLKYYSCRGAMISSIRKKHKDSKDAKLPYREKRFLPTGWDYQSFRIDYQNKKIKLAGIKNRGQVTCEVKFIPNNVIEVELVFKGKYYLALKYKKESQSNLIQSDNISSIDLGEIHAITSIDKLGNCVIITNRKVKSLIRLKDKRQAELLSKRMGCSIGSIKYKKYTKAIYKIRDEFNRKIIDLIHKQSRAYVDWCIENKVAKVYYGDVDTTTRNSKGRLNQHTNHKLNMWRFGQITQKCEYKLLEYGIEMIKISEAYSSQTCPKCKKLNKPTNRNYICKSCGYEQHRDVVGAINILNFNTNSNLTKYANKVYLQIA